MGDHGQLLWTYPGGLNGDPPASGRVVAVRDAGDHGEVLWSVEARGEIWLSCVFAPHHQEGVV